MFIFLGIVLTLLLLTLGDGKYTSKAFMKTFYNIFGTKMFRKSEKEIWMKTYKDLNVQTEDKILDVGTATGDMPLTIAAFCDHQGMIYGIDWSSNMIASAIDKSKTLNVDHHTCFEVVNLKKGLPYEDHHFDHTLCMGLLEGYIGYEQLINELCRVTKKHGQVAVSLYKSGVKISRSNYEKAFKSNGYTSFTVVRLRKMHDLLIAKR